MTQHSDEFGPQTAQIRALIERAEQLTDDEMQRLEATWNAARDADWDADWDAVWDAVWDAAMALVVRDLIGQHGFEQSHYDLLTRPWRDVIGPVHPDDEQETT